MERPPIVRHLQKNKRVHGPSAIALTRCYNRRVTAEYTSEIYQEAKRVLASVHMIQHPNMQEPPTRSDLLELDGNRVEAQRRELLLEARFGRFHLIQRRTKRDVDLLL